MRKRGWEYEQTAKVFYFRELCLPVWLATKYYCGPYILYISLLKNSKIFLHWNKSSLVGTEFLAFHVQCFSALSRTLVSWQSTLKRLGALQLLFSTKPCPSRCSSLCISCVSSYAQEISSLEKWLAAFQPIGKKFWEIFSLVSLCKEKFSFSFEKFRMYQQSRKGKMKNCWIS